MRNALSSSFLTVPREDGIRYEMIGHLSPDTQEFGGETQ